MKIKYNIPILSDREARYNSTSFLFQTNKKWMFPKLYGNKITHQLNRYTNREKIPGRTGKFRHKLNNLFKEMVNEPHAQSTFLMRNEMYSPVNFHPPQRKKAGWEHTVPSQNMSKASKDELLDVMKYYYDVREYKSTRLNGRGEYELHCPRPSIGQKHKEDPLFELIRKQIEDILIPSRTAKNDFSDNLVKWNMTFRYADGDATVMLERKASGFYIDNVKMVKEDVVSAIAKILLRSIYVRSEEVLMDYVEKVTTIPYNVLYALENRTPYYYYDYGERKNVKIDTKLISNTKVALQISDGIWAGMTVTELNRFISYYKHGRKRAKKWIQISPKNLWNELLGEMPTSSQEKMMLAWLSQNRTEKIVVERAEKLLIDLDNEYPQITFTRWPNEQTNALHVRGKVCDWVISANRGMKRGHQDVSTYRVGKKSSAGNQGQKFAGHALSNSICIDNLHNNSTANDQLAARAMVLLNDKMARQMVYTLSHLLESAENDPDWQFTARVSDKELAKIAREVS